MKKLYYFFLLAVGLTITGCSNDDGAPKVEDNEEEITELVLTGAESRAAEQIQGFNSNFFKAVVASQQGVNNVVCSPLSASIALSMVANGTDGVVRNEITKALNCSDLAALNSLSHKYLKALPVVDKDVKFASANAVWFNNKYTISPDFAKVTKDYFDAGCYGRDFAGAKQVVDEINGWVNEQTNGIIRKMLAELPSDAAAVLANALYFKGAWTAPFDAKATKDATFTGAKGAQAVKMMHKTGAQEVYLTDEFKAVRLGFGQGLYEAVFILPAGDVDTFIGKADFDQILKGSFGYRAVALDLPRYKYTPAGNVDLNTPLAAMGMKSLSMRSPLKMFSNDIEAQHNLIQQTGIEFTEEGAEGTSATLDIPVESAGPNATNTLMELKFDRPFVFIINETTTGAMLFAGKVAEI